MHFCCPATHPALCPPRSRKLDCDFNHSSKLWHFDEQGLYPTSTPATLMHPNCFSCVLLVTCIHYGICASPSAKTNLLHLGFTSVICIRHDVCILRSPFVNICCHRSSMWREVLFVLEWLAMGNVLGRFALGRFTLASAATAPERVPLGWLLLTLFERCYSVDAILVPVCAPLQHSLHIPAMPRSFMCATTPALFVLLPCSANNYAICEQWKLRIIIEQALQCIDRKISVCCRMRADGWKFLRMLQT